MTKKKSKKLIVFLIVALNFSVWLMLTKSVEAGVVFETNFDTVQSWTPRMVLDACWQTTPIEGGGNSCTNLPWATPFNPSTSIWNDYRVTPPQCSSIPVQTIGTAAEILSATGKTVTPYGGSGKSYVQIYEPCMSSSGGWGSGSALGVYLGKTTGYSELYVRMNVRFQPGFQWQNGSQQKLIHIAHFNEDTNQGVLQAYQFFSSNLPDFVSTLYTNTTYWPSPCFQMDSVRTDTSYIITSPVCASGNISDGNWHEITFHVKLNSAAGKSDGIEETYLDGSLITSQTDIPWTLSNTPSPSIYGFNRVIIAGNSNNLFGPADGRTQWFSVDNLIVSTTPIPAGYAIGGQTTPPPPTNLRKN